LGRIDTIAAPPGFSPHGNVKATVSGEQFMKTTPTMTVEFSTTENPLERIEVKNVSVVELTGDSTTIITKAGMEITIPSDVLEDLSWKADD
jgi:hypothetical protein